MEWTQWLGPMEKFGYGSGGGGEWTAEGSILNSINSYLVILTMVKLKMILL